MVGRIQNVHESTEALRQSIDDLEVSNLYLSCDLEE